MAYSDWLDRLPSMARITKKGARIDLWMYVYPSGQGSIQFVRPDGKGDVDQPVNNVDEAVAAIRDLWERASRLHDKDVPV